MKLRLTKQTRRRRNAKEEDTGNQRRGNSINIYMHTSSKQDGKRASPLPVRRPFYNLPQLSLSVCLFVSPLVAFGLQLNERKLKMNMEICKSLLALLLTTHKFSRLPSDPLALQRRSRQSTKSKVKYSINILNFCTICTQVLTAAN